MEQKKPLSLPADFIASIENEHDDAFSASLFSAIADTTAPVSIRFNSSKKEAKVMQPIPWEPYATYLDKRPHFVTDPLWHAAAYYVQEASSMIIGYVVDSLFVGKEGLKVLDLCAAPGGKTTQLLSVLPNDAIIVCNELIGKRATILKENIIKWGYANAIVCNNEVSHFSYFQNSFDLILIDAPCSGEGMFRKDPESIAEWSLQRVSECSIRQKKILDEAVGMIKENGILIYSTCTYNEEENINNIVYLILNYDMEVVTIDLPVEWGFQAIKKEQAIGWQAFPNQVKGEGFFFSVMRKKKHQFKSQQILHKGKVVDTQIASAHEKEVFSKFLKDAEQYNFIKKNDDWYAVLKSQYAFFSLLLQQMNVIYFGIKLGQFKKENFIPDAALALSIQLHPEIRRIDLEQEDAIRFLKKENVYLNDIETAGWAAVTFDGVVLGWIKILQDGRINNYYPMEWRIKMNLDKLV